MKNKNNNYVYVYLDPRKPGEYVYGKYKFNYEPFYIGKGSRNRMYSHINIKSLNCDKNKHKANRIKLLLFNNFDLHDEFINKISDNLSIKDAFDLEIKLISLIGRSDLRTGPLLNMSEGGEGGDNSHNINYDSKECELMLPKGMHLLSVNESMMDSEKASIQAVPALLLRVFFLWSLMIFFLSSIFNCLRFLLGNIKNRLTNVLQTTRFRCKTPYFRFSRFKRISLYNHIIIRVF